MTLKRFVQLLISVFLLAVLIYWIDFAKFINSVKNANYFYIFIAFIIATSNRCIMAFKWNLLLKAKNIKVSFYEVAKIYYISTFFGLYLPPTIGADIVRIFLLNKKKYQLSDIISSIIVERIIGFLVLLFFAVIGGIFFYLFFGNFQFDIKNVLKIFILITLFGFLIFIISFNEKISTKVLVLLDRLSSVKVIGKFASILQRLYDSYLLFKNSKAILIIFFFLTGLEVFIYILRSYIVAQALNVDVPFIYMFSFVPVIMALIRLPFSLNGFGINEAGYVYFLSLIDIPNAIGFSVGLIDHFIVIIAILPGAIFYLLDQSFQAPYKNKIITKVPVDGQEL